jgi:Pyruvate/2-oxoacid:ferredoxin oxidoreductase gamma subunit
LPEAVCIPATRIAPGAVNLVMLGALADALGEPSLEQLVAAAVEVLGKKADPEVLRAAVEGGFNAAKEQRCAA